MFPNNFCSYKESYTPEKTPGGGGWSIQQLSLGNLFVQNSYLMNKWTKSNISLNLCRYYGVSVTLYRQPTIDYIFMYYREEPKKAGKYWYPSFHPIQLILEKNRIVVPSMQTKPHKKKNYKKIWIHPPKLFKSEWYFQQHISNYPLIYFVATACSLQSMFLSSKSANSNVTIPTLNTNFWQKPAFQYTSGEEGYNPKSGTYIYGLRNGTIGDLKDELKKNVIYLGETHYNFPGNPIGIQQFIKYKKEQWGNPFYFEYINLIRTVFLADSPKNFLKNVQATDKIGETAIKKQEPMIYYARYNPYKDKGDGNMAYWLSVSDATKNNWDPPKDEDLIISGYPFWLMLWGWEDYTKKLGKISQIEDNYLLVLRSKYFSEGLKAYVPLNESFLNGRATWDRDSEYISTYDQRNWFPKWKFQKETINNLLMSGPGVCKAENVQSIQAFLRYNFYFKWGGDPATMEKIADPNSQPTSTIPSEFNLQNEIINPQTSLENYIYRWDVRRDYLTQAAQQRITKSPTNDYSVFTDGKQTSTDVSLQKAPQTQTTQETQEETLLLNLEQLQQYNRELQHRLKRLKNLMEQ